MKLFSAALFLFSFEGGAFAQSDLLTRPFLSKVLVERSDNLQQCSLAIKKSISRLNKKLDVAQLGNFQIIQDGSRCYSFVLLASKSPIQRSQFEETFNDTGLVVSSLVNTNDATYMSYKAIVSFDDGSYEYCENQQEKRSRFLNWIEGYGQLNEIASKIKDGNVEEKRKWIQTNFNCQNIESAKSVEIVFDITNREYCSLDSETIKTCFILRGLQQYFINL